MLSIIIPTLNEEEGIAKVLCSIPRDVWDKSEIIVSDVSDDSTPLIAERLGAKVIREEKKGKGWQIRQAVKKSKGDILVFLDGDGTDPGNYIPKLLEKLETADLVLGCRNLGDSALDDPNMREIFQVYRLFIPPVFRLIGLNVSDPLAGFRVIRRKDWEKLDLQSSSFEIETEMNIKALKAGLKIAAIPIPNLKRCGGFEKSKFIKNPKAWLKMSELILKYFVDDKLKIKIRDLEKKVKVG